MSRGPSKFVLIESDADYEYTAQHVMQAAKENDAAELTNILQDGKISIKQIMAFEIKGMQHCFTVSASTAAYTAAIDVVVASVDSM